MKQSEYIAQLLAARAAESAKQFIPSQFSMAVNPVQLHQGKMQPLVITGSSNPMASYRNIIGGIPQFNQGIPFNSSHTSFQTSVPHRRSVISNTTMLSSTPKISNIPSSTTQKTVKRKSPPKTEAKSIQIMDAIPINTEIIDLEK